MPRNRRTAEQIREDMEDLTTEVALGVGMKGVIGKLFQDSIDETDGFQGPLLSAMEDAFKTALEPYPTSDETALLHTEYNDLNKKVENIEDKIDDLRDISKFLDVGNERPYNDFFEVIEEIVEEKTAKAIEDEVKNAFQDVGKHFVSNILDEFVSKLISEMNKVNETPEEKIARLEQELADRDV